jgi:Uma2 family endonuclease
MAGVRYNTASAREEATMSTAEATPVEELPITIRGPLRMSYEEWLDHEHEGGLTEWVDGEVIVHMPTKDEHQRVVEFLHLLIGHFVRLYRLGMVRLAPFAMRLAPDGPGREPDLFFLAAANAERLTRRQLTGPADLVVEVVSDDSVRRDRDEKFYEYQAGGVREYWVIDPRPGRLRADFFVLDERGLFQPVPLPLDNIYRSSVVTGFWLKTDWLWQEDPDPLAALGQIAGAERVLAALTVEGA